MEYMIFAMSCVAAAVAYCAGVTVWTCKKLAEMEIAMEQRIHEVKQFAADKVEGAEARIMEYREDDLAAVQKLTTAVSNLEQGIVPDFEEAKKAAKAVNDFNTGISAIMGYDPMEARRKMREGRKGEIE